MQLGKKDIEEILERPLPSPTHQHLVAAKKRVAARLEVERRRGLATPQVPSGSRPAGSRRAIFAMASAAVVMALVAFVGIPLRDQGLYAVLEAADSSMYRISDGNHVAVRVGDRIAAQEMLRSNGGAGAILALSDGSRIEIGSKSEMWWDRAEGGLMVRLNTGSIIVSSEKEATGQLYVKTKDITASIARTTSLVNAAEDGSSVAVIAGEAKVREGRSEKWLRPGEHLSTSLTLAARPLPQAIAWSRNAGRLLAMLAASAAPAVFTAPVTADSPQATLQNPNLPKWDAVSVKPCAMRGLRGGGARLSPGRMALNCQPVSAFIAWAYVQYAGGRARPISAIGKGGTALEGGPSWIHSDRYTIEATANGGPGNAAMQGPMLQAILEDRFKVKVHTETREVPIYNLTVEPGGPKLRPFKRGSCVPIDIHREEPVPPPLPEGQRYCDSFVTPNGATISIHAEGSSVEEFVTLFLSTLSLTERRVVDRTGITGLFDIELEFTPQRLVDDPAASQAGVSIFTALREQLGLRLESARGPAEFLVIDYVERPTEN